MLQLLQVLYYTFSTLQHDSYFFEAAISWATVFFEDMLIQNRHFFQRSYFFQNSYFFRGKLLQVATFCMRKFFRAVAFQNSYFLDTEWKYLEKSYIFEAASTFSKKLQFGRKLILQKSNIPHYLVFWRAAFLSWLLFSKDAAIYDS